jgi:ABC-type transporter Mla MlaB component
MNEPAYRARSAHIQASGSLDREAAADLSTRAIEAARCSDELILDLSGITQMDGSVVAAVAGLAVRCGQQTRLQVLPPSLPSCHSWSLLGGSFSPGEEHDRLRWSAR